MALSDSALQAEPEPEIPKGERRQRIVMLTESNIIGILEGTTRLKGLPHGTKPLRVFADPFSNGVAVVIEHHSFSHVEEGFHIPMMYKLELESLYHDPTRDDD